jgi:putative ubiquitin-RnfH superfamily antitoxin RatB of RatAB toxin-antitoxin module|tara:strand:- start:1192 stop:1524 length:333 start_codon:yes stop_codon:yes gene_type:complete
MTESHTCDASYIHVEVVFAQPDTIWRKTLQAPMGTTARQALDQSGFDQAFPNGVRQVGAMGVYGQRCRDDYILADGDRLELYRPLQFDPKESRRRRAMHKQRVKNGSSSV